MSGRDIFPSARAPPARPAPSISTTCGTPRESFPRRRARRPSPRFPPPDWQRWRSWCWPWARSSSGSGIRRWPDRSPRKEGCPYFSPAARRPRGVVPSPALHFQSIMAKYWIYLCFFLSGFSGLVNEVVWSRLFVYTMGTSNLSIAVVVSMFMGGLALGSAIGGPFADRLRSPLRFYGALVLLAGLLSGAVAPLLWLLEPLLGFAYRLHDGQPNHPLFTAVKAVVCAGTILVPTTLMGATLPALARHLTASPREGGARFGTLYDWSCLGR